MKIEIKHRYTNKVLYSHEEENNTILKTLQRANLDEANLYGANLERANLDGANLYGVNLERANLDGANLYGVNLERANLYGANLERANLYGANLYGANLERAILTPIKNDLFLVLMYALKEIPNLKKAIVDGKIDGSTYEGECTCLCGTLEKSKDEKLAQQIYDLRDARRPIERFFATIKKGDTIETNPNSKLALEWIEEFESIIKSH